MIDTLKTALTKSMREESIVSFVDENEYYYEFIIKRYGHNYFYIKWHKDAAYFSEVISLSNAGVNPIDVNAISNATEEARKNLFK